ncbi:MAG: hypothetical protein RBU30_02785 [Polyangia bacterium]|nr:hypothetical protein [Polyangia bacterium]
MLDDRQREALRLWYRREAVLGEARRLAREERWEGLEELIEMRALIPLSRHGELPEYLLTAAGPLIPSNCNPRVAPDDWRDAVELGWKVIGEATGISRNDVHLKIKAWQDESWEAFLESPSPAASPYTSTRPGSTRPSPRWLARPWVPVMTGASSRGVSQTGSSPTWEFRSHPCMASAALRSPGFLAEEAGSSDNSPLVGECAANFMLGIAPVAAIR